MFRLNRVRVKLSGALKRQQCGILHNRVSKAHVKTWWIEQHITFLPSIATFTLDSTALHHVLFLLHNRRQVWPKRLWKRAEAKSTKLWFCFSRLIVQHKPGLCTCDELWFCSSSAVPQLWETSLLSDAFYRLHVCTSYSLLKLMYLKSGLQCKALSGLFICVLSLITILGTISYALSCMHVIQN